MPDFADNLTLPEHLKGVALHLVGAKGTGMCALAELFVASGASVSGSDVDERFYTDVILQELGVKMHPFEAASLSPDIEWVVRSAAYDETNPVVAEALKRGLPILTYPEALGSMSRRYDASAVAGVHGKTTTAALAGTLAKGMELPATVVVGSAVAGFGDRSTWRGGDKFLIAETCEYRRHFLQFHPRRIILTSVEPDHQDYYPDYDSIRDAFVDFIHRLPKDGELIYCADDPGASDVVQRALESREDIVVTPYGVKADGAWKVLFGDAVPGENRFRTAGSEQEYSLAVPGRHVALDAVAALALMDSLMRSTGGKLDVRSAAEAFSTFRGSRRRSEIIGEAGGVLVMDDYAHHPTAIAATLSGLTDFHPDRRLVVDFMPHTYSRTAALLSEFAACFQNAQILLLHPIYASARERFDGTVTGRTLWRDASENREKNTTLYCETLDDAAERLEGILQPGDLFLTLGAGNNRPLGKMMMEKLAHKDVS
ncbi:MAG: UDP-N-acetylmuramate--L-alanine ligase [Spirochaetaceae bacterium]|nr:UDP-N-acetylmuramate--L-alanine ligase [Spirochaetaceae bacterium]